ncbi:SfnB family sulfur acquisition oxidoreductase [Pseudomonas sp. 5P_3.1_Bac2]|uniref:SfnB family sulfur acquisition oxidoreductase n=1 Tax=Pseudomonas sp. 5P_3.1_Bac2 TaxID=2971617 RepID=UPI0021C9EE93|nr:SfnB family sulfur acquisition oxidoreductase [Pseudomonas sp. 5P_3.1_Bac2]MCU1717365.1 SfnB family sulfur acquisition oxidoreductase [Pseudomonas sp. 5P_3.1_Bac2]
MSQAEQIIRPQPSQPAQRLSSEAQAISVARELAAQFAKDAIARDRERRLPLEELDAYSQSGLWSILVPKAYGGLGASYRTVGEVFRLISAADGSLGQLPQNHFVILAHLAFDASEEQKRFFFDLVLSGVRFGNAFSERGGKNVADFQTRIEPAGDGFVVNGQKFFSTGALLAHWIPIVGLDAEGRPNLAIVPRQTPGVKVSNDWSSFGQRTTASGTVNLDNVQVPASQVIPIWQAFERPTAGGPISQFIQAAIDAGLARGALDDTLAYVRQHTRAWVDSGQEKATDDPFILQQVGDIQLRLHAAEALLERAADAIDQALLEPSDASVALASIRTAEAKILTTEVALQASNKLFELAGTRSTLEELGLDRHWRNARVHTLHDPVRWKYHILGNYYLNGIDPARHPWL